MGSPPMRSETRALFDAALGTLTFLRRTMRTDRAGGFSKITLDYEAVLSHCQRLEAAIEAIDPDAVTAALREITAELRGATAGDREET